MKSLTSIALKLLGIVFFYWFLTSLTRLAVFFPQLPVYETAWGDYSFFPIIIGNVFYSVIIFFISFILMFQTDKVVKLLKFNDKKMDFGNITLNGLLQSGIKIIGIFIFITRSEIFLRNLIYWFTRANVREIVNGQTTTVYGRETTLIELITLLLPIVLSVICIAHTDFLIKLIYKAEEKAS